MKVGNLYHQYKLIDVDVGYQQIDSNREDGYYIRDIHGQHNGCLLFEFHQNSQFYFDF